MDVANNIWDIIDANARELARDIEVQNYALQGLLERSYRSSQNILALKMFVALSDDIIDLAQRSVYKITDQFADAASEHLVGAEPRGLFANEFSDLEIVIGSHVEQLRGLHVRQLKHMLSSRSVVSGMLRLASPMTRSGASIPTGEFTYLVARRAFIDWFNLNQMEALRSLGRKTALVIHRDTEHAFHGTELALTDDQANGFPTYDEVADEIFHPRSYAVIGGS